MPIQAGRKERAKTALLKEDYFGRWVRWVGSTSFGAI